MLPDPAANPVPLPRIVTVPAVSKDFFMKLRRVISLLFGKKSGEVFGIFIVVLINCFSRTYCSCHGWGGGGGKIYLTEGQSIFGFADSVSQIVS